MEFFLPAMFPRGNQVENSAACYGGHGAPSASSTTMGLELVGPGPNAPRAGGARLDAAM